MKRANFVFATEGGFSFGTSRMGTGLSPAAPAGDATASQCRPGLQEGEGGRAHSPHSLSRGPVRADGGEHGRRRLWMLVDTADRGQVTSAACGSRPAPRPRPPFGAGSARLRSPVPSPLLRVMGRRRGFWELAVQRPRAEPVLGAQTSCGSWRPGPSACYLGLRRAQTGPDGFGAPLSADDSLFISPPRNLTIKCYPSPEPPRAVCQSPSSTWACVTGSPRVWSGLPSRGPSRAWWAGLDLPDWHPGLLS